MRATPSKTGKQASSVCQIRGCIALTSSARAKYCRMHFLKQAATSNLRRKQYGGNRTAKGSAGNAGNKNAKGTPGHAGNKDAKGTPGHAGNKDAKGKGGNAGNKDAKGKGGNAGNKVKGASKRRAGKRSALRRCAPVALVIKETWLRRILSGEKTWEIRATATMRRGRIHLAQSGGLLMGSATISGCTRLKRGDFLKHQDKHCISRLKQIPYKVIWAWHLESVRRYTKPFPFKKSRGAMIWAYPRCR